MASLIKKKAYLRWYSFSRPQKGHTAECENTVAGVGSGTIDIHNWRCVGGIVIMSIRYRCVRRCTSYPQISQQLTRPWGSPLSIGYVGPQHSHRVSHKTHLLPVDITCVCVFVAICYNPDFPKPTRRRALNDLKFLSYE